MRVALLVSAMLTGCLPQSSVSSIQSSSAQITVEQGPANAILDVSRLVTLPDGTTDVEYQKSGTIAYLFSSILEDSIVIDATGSNTYHSVRYFKTTPHVDKQLADKLGVELVRKKDKVSVYVLRDGQGQSSLIRTKEASPPVVNADGDVVFSGSTIDDIVAFLHKTTKRHIINKSILGGKWSCVIAKRSIVDLETNADRVLLGDTKLVVAKEEIVCDVISIQKK